MPSKKQDRKKGRKRPRRRQLETNKSWYRFVPDEVLRRWMTSIERAERHGTWSGTPRKTSIRKDRFLIREATRERNPVDACPSVTDLSKSLKQRTSTQISPLTAQGRLHEKNFKKFPKTKKPYVSQENRRKQFLFARSYLHWTLTNRKRSSGLTNHHLSAF